MSIWGARAMHDRLRAKLLLLRYWRSLSAADEEEIQADVDRILASGEPGQTLEELREELGLRDKR